MRTATFLLAILLFNIVCKLFDEMLFFLLFYFLQSYMDVIGISYQVKKINKLQQDEMMDFIDAST